MKIRPQKTNSLLSVLCFIFCSNLAVGQFNPNMSLSYFENVAIWDNFYDSIRTKRLNAGDSSMGGVAYNSYVRWKCFWGNNVPPNGSFVDAIKNMQAQKRHFDVNNRKSKSSSDKLAITPEAWTEIGPTKVTDIFGEYPANTWVNTHLEGQNNAFQFNPNVGKFDRLFQHPTVSNRLYAVSGQAEASGGGLFMSNDFGVTWTILGTDAIPNPIIVAFAVKPMGVLPNSAQEILFLATAGGTVYRSADAGVTWIEAGYNGTSSNPPGGSGANSLPYSYDFVNNVSMLNINSSEYYSGLLEVTTVCYGPKLAPTNPNYSKFDRLFVARRNALYYSDNSTANLSIINNGTQISNSIVWQQVNLTSLINAIPYISGSAVSKQFLVDDIEYYSKSNSIYYLMSIEVMELDVNNNKIPGTRKYIYRSTDYGLSWTMLGTVGDQVNSRLVYYEAVVKRHPYCPTNIEVLPNNPNYIYIASSTSEGGLNFTSNFALNRWNLTTSAWENLSVSDNSFSNNSMISQSNGFAINPQNEHEYVFYTNTCNRYIDNTLMYSYFNYGEKFHADVRDVLFLGNNHFFVATDGGINETLDGGVTFRDRSSGLNATQFSSLAVAQKPPFYVAAGTWHSGLQVYNPNVNQWHWGIVADGAGAEIPFLNNEVFAFNTQSAALRIVKDFNQFASISLSNGYDMRGSENTDGRVFYINNQNPSTLFIVDDFAGSGSPVVQATNLNNLPRYNAQVKVIPNEPDKICIYNSQNRTLNFYSGVSANNLVLLNSFSLDGIYAAISGTANPSGFANITFDPDKNGEAFLILRGGNDWNSIENGRIISLNYLTGVYADMSYPLNETFIVGTGNFIPNYISVRDIVMDRENKNLYIGTSNGVYILDKGEQLWKKFSSNLPCFNVDLDVLHCTGEIYGATQYRGAWKTDLDKQAPKAEWHITSNTTWSSRVNLFHTLVIDPGVTLTVTSKLIVYGDQKIIVKPGAKLVVDAGLITTECGTYWAGIEVWGNSTLAQNATNQGTLDMKNGATIENAHEAIQVWKPNDWNSTGGIVTATNSHFKNNRRSVSYLQYHSYSTSNPSIEYPNKGRFINCDFIWDNNFSPLFSLSSAITLYHVNGVIISGCTFDEQRTGITQNQKHSGVYCLDAKTSIIGLNLNINAPPHETYSTANYDVSVFKNLNRGIEAGNSATQSVVTIDHCLFTDNYNGVLLTQSDNGVVTRNRFEQINVIVPAGSFLKAIVQLTLEKSLGFKVEGNQFYSSVDNAKTIGCYVVNSGVQNTEIYKNSFTNLQIGNYGVYQNQNGDATNNGKGLQFKCNTYSNPKGSDESTYLLNQTDITQGIRLKQGLTNQAAKNQFTVIPLGNPFAVKHVWSTDNDNLIYYYSPGSNQQPTSNSASVGVALSTVNDISCPSSFSTIIIESEKSMLSGDQKNTIISAYKDAQEAYKVKSEAFNALTSKGNSDVLLSSIKTMNEQNKQVVLEAVDAQSPFVSERILRELGNLSKDLVSESSYFELLMNNPERMQNEEFFQWLQTKANPLSADHIRSISAKRFSSYSNYSVKADELMLIDEKMTKDCNLLLQNAVSGENLEWNDYFDWTTKREDVLHYLQLADAYLGTGNVEQFNSQILKVKDEIAQIANQEVRSEMKDFIDFKEYLMRITDGTGRIQLLDQNEIDQLLSFRDNSKGISSVQAQNILCFHAGICNETFVPIDEKTLNNTNGSVDVNKTETSLSSDDLLIIPNPNKGSFMLSRTDGCQILNIVVSDAQGKFFRVETSSIEDNTLKVDIVDIVDVASGVYLLNVICSDGATRQARVVVE